MSDAFTRRSLDSLKQDIANALKTVEKKHGVSLGLEKLTAPQFYRAEFKLVALRESPHRAEYLAHAQELGLEPVWLGRTFVDAPTASSAFVEMRIVGLDRSKLETPLLCEIIKNDGTATGRVFLYSVTKVVDKMKVVKT